MKKVFVSIGLVLLIVPLVAAFINPGEGVTQAELNQVSYNNGIFVIILVVALVFVAVVYYFLTRKKQTRQVKKRVKKR